MSGWVAIIGVASYWEARALRGRCPTLSFVCRKLPRRYRALMLAWLCIHFLSDD